MRKPFTGSEVMPAGNLENNDKNLQDKRNDDGIICRLKTEDNFECQCEDCKVLESHSIPEDIYSLAEKVCQNHFNPFHKPAEKKANKTPCQIITALAVMNFVLTYLALFSVMYSVITARHVDIYIYGTEWYNIPVMVTTPTRASQLLALLFTIFITSEELYSSFASISCTCNKEGANDYNKYSWLWRILRLVNGLFVFYLCTLTIISIDNALDLFKEFVSLVFIVDFDEVIYKMVSFGIFGDKVQNLAEKTVLKVHRNASRNVFEKIALYRFGVLMLITLPFYIIFVLTWIYQANFKFGCDVIKVQVSGLKGSKAIEGLYHMSHTDGSSGYPMYALKYSGANISNVFGNFCLNYNISKKKWQIKICKEKFYESWDVVKNKMFAESVQETYLYDPTDDRITWKLYCGGSGFCLDTTVELSCKRGYKTCENDGQCGDGVCDTETRNCDCQNKAYGINCEHTLPSSSIDIDGLVDQYGLLHGPRFSLVPSSINTGLQTGLETHPIYYDLKQSLFSKSEWTLSMFRYGYSRSWEIVDIGIVELYYDDTGVETKLIYCFKPFYSVHGDQVHEIFYEKNILKTQQYCTFLYDGWLEDIIIRYRDMTNKLPLILEYPQIKTLSETDRASLNNNELVFSLLAENQYLPKFTSFMPSTFESMNGDIKDPPPLGYMKGKLWQQVETEIKYSDAYSMIEIGCEYPTNGYSGINCEVPPWKISLDIFWKIVGSKTCRVVENARPSPSQDGFCQVMFVKPFQFNDNMYGRLAVFSTETHVNLYYTESTDTNDNQYSVPTIANKFESSTVWAKWLSDMNRFQTGQSLPEFCKPNALIRSFLKKEKSYSVELHLFLNTSGIFTLAKDVTADCKDGVSQEYIDGDYGPTSWGGAQGEFSEFLKLNLTLTVGKKDANGFVRKLSNIPSESIVDADTGKNIPTNSKTNFLALRNAELKYFLEPDIGDNINTREWCNMGTYLAKYNGSGVWSQDDATKKDFVRSRSCNNVFFKKTKLV